MGKLFLAAIAILAACQAEPEIKSNRELAEDLAEASCTRGITCGATDLDETCALSYADWICARIDCTATTPEYGTWASECIDWIRASECTQISKPTGCDVASWPERL